MEDGRKRPAPVMTKQSGNIFKEQIRRPFCLSQPGNFKEQGTSRVCKASAVPGSRKRLAGKSSAQEVEVGNFVRIGFFDIFTEPLSFGIKQSFIASVGLFVNFTMADTGKSSGAGEPLSEPADAGEQVNISYCLSYHAPSLKICKQLRDNQAASLLSNGKMKYI